MSQPFTVQSANNRSPLRIGQIIFTVLALLSFALGSVLLSLVWFGVGVTTTGKDFGAATEGRGFAFILLWPATMFAVWISARLHWSCQSAGFWPPFPASCHCHPLRYMVG